MHSIALKIPESLARQSSLLAKELGVSRVAFIRQAIQHEIEFVRKKRELTAMTNSFTAMKQDVQYQQEMNDWQNFPDTLPDETEKWWK